jgi:hypothetical protein
VLKNRSCSLGDSCLLQDIAESLFGSDFCSLGGEEMIKLPHLFAQI